MVEYIDLEIPLSADVDNPIEDDAFLARIGANEICDFSNWFELKNTATGTRFTFQWNKYSAFPYSNFRLQRNE